ncbi:transketolase [Oleidesulfovibrio alaskensis G20]|jgi:transketolase|uniref:Transketolase n=1 Tax=Oleidesulfovibrio alaskensis (strain ATCC BAA-1058 / DSM 17464 / G20) TaxID=207559 RepID=Q30Y19_OLEA2|nr:transketolase [Oleidesulfovibrio alaskensis]ABB39427.1 transketolase [Oleidesulfovibrio alaskensis G20]MBG0772495.1 transketolase [Oleidesulfovibrio alaskensis]MBL3582143.1 transketolase [Oleidesulfovibrio alaskensis]
MASRKDLANAIRALSMDAVEKAKSGHPGAPMGMADMAEVLWNDFMKHNPANPGWADRDRFVLSNGHGSMLIYSLLHLSGYDLSIDDIRNFRQLHSKTPGHPEYGVTPGVETTTGPLGQGIATAVGMAMAERMLAEAFNRDGFTVVDHHTYVFLGDGCMMEGLSHEACSLAGTLGLGKLVALYDDNGISIDGRIDSWFGDDTPARFRAYGWHVVAGVDGHDAEAVRKAIEEARAETGRPSLICCKTKIGMGAPNMADSSKVHGAPLGADEIAATRANIGWNHPPFEIPADVYAGWDARPRGAAAQQVWDDMFAAYAAAHPALAAEFTRRMAGDLPEGWKELCEKALAQIVAAAENLATRKACNKSLEAIGPALPEMVGGSADLTGSVGTKWSGSRLLDSANWGGNYISYGVREFAMGAIMNGLTLHGGFLPYAGTFLIFSDYAKNAFRLSALMGIRTVWVLTHDSIGVGEDGPTHQPVEQLAGLRLIPGAHVWRPCDTVETQVAWQSAVEYKNGPTALSFTRQGVPFMQRDDAAVRNIARGGYVLRDCEGTPEVILIATGSEVGVAAGACDRLTAEGRRVRLVSMPCSNIFDRQDAAYRESVLPAAVEARVAVEAAASDFWWKYVGLKGRVVGMTTFGESAPGKVLFEHFGFTADNVAAVAKEVL